MNFLLLAFLSPALSLAAPIDWSQQDIYSSAELVNDCVSSSNQNSAQKCKDMVKNARAELPAWEACNSFKMPESNAVDQTEKSDEEVKPILARAALCLPIVDGKAFAPNALDICSLSMTPDFHQECLKGIADGSFNNAAFNLCTEHADAEIRQSVNCLVAIKDKNLTQAEVAACANAPTTADKASCLKNKGTNVKSDLKECNQKLADVQTKISGMAANSSEATLKTQLQGIVDAIQNQTPATFQPAN